MTELNKKAAGPAQKGPATKTIFTNRHAMSHPVRQGELPKYLRDMISSPPRHTEGVHWWLFRAAKALHRHRDSQTICEILARATDGCGRVVPPREIEDAVNNSRQWAGKSSAPRVKGRALPTPSRWPERDEAKIAAIAAADPEAMARLMAASPIKISESLHDADALLERLFPGNPLLCIADGPTKATTLHRQDLGGIAGHYSHIVPTPMCKKIGTNKTGKPSRRCLDNTGPRLYIVTECDQGSRDQQCAIIRHLATVAPLTMVVCSAGKSLHAWWHCHGQPEDRLQRFFRMAVALGADPATWTRCQLVRMPLGTRGETNARQRVLYFDYRRTEAARQRKGGAA